MTKPYILALDQGTTSSRAMLFDAGGRTVVRFRQFGQIYPNPGWVEHDPNEIFESQMRCAKELLAEAGVSASEIAGIAITNQRETAVVWDKQTGKPVYNAIVWQCRRTAAYMEGLKAGREDDLIFDKTGLEADAYFSASKVRWILNAVPGARKRAQNGELLFGTVDSYLLYRLTDGRVHATDYTNASRTLLFNIHTRTWDEELCKLFDVPLSMLPAVHPSGYAYGTTTAFGGELPVLSLCGDQQAALYGHGCIHKGDIKNTYGTGCFLLMNTGDEPVRSHRGLLTSLAAGLTERPSYILEGSVFIAGAVIQWLRDELNLIQTAEESETLARSVPDTAGVTLVPAFVGLGAPYWDSGARGILSGLTRGVKRAHIVRAALESIAFQVFDVLHAMERDLEIDVTALNVDGGASRNNFLMQFQADILPATVLRSGIIETTALGAAILAGQTAGLYDQSIFDTVKIGATRFDPAMPEAKRRERLQNWQSAVARCRVKD